MYAKYFLTIILFTYNFFLISQSVELKKEFRNTNKFFKEKNYDKALISNEKALILSKKEFGDNHLTTATLIENKGRLFLELKQFKKSESLFKEVIKIRKSIMEKTDPDIAEALNYLALSLREQNKLDDAILIHNEVLTIMGNVIANNPGQISELTRRSALYRARAYQTKGQILLKENKVEDAKGNFRIAIRIFERTLGKNKKELDFLKDKIKSLK